MKKLNRKGFTLVEIIVVLVIIAILAAAGIPAMVRFIGEARAKAYIAEARVCYTAIQTSYTELYITENSTDPTGYNNTVLVNAQALVAGDITGTLVSWEGSGGRVTSVVYTIGRYTITIAPNVPAVVTIAPA